MRETDDWFISARCLLGEFLLKSEKPLFALQAFQRMWDFPLALMMDPKLQLKAISA